MIVIVEKYMMTSLDHTEMKMIKRLQALLPPPKKLNIEVAKIMSIYC